MVTAKGHLNPTCMHKTHTGGRGQDHECIDENSTAGQEIPQGRTLHHGRKIYSEKGTHGPTKHTDD